MALVLVRTLLLVAALGLAACTSTPHPAGEAKTVEVKPAPAPPPKDARPAIVVLGDSLSAGYGLEAGQSFPDHLQSLLDAGGYRFRVVNQGLSGDTTTGGLSRLEACLAEKPRLVILELGGNDGLRGTPVAQMKQNLETMIQRVKASGAEVLLAGITLPPNYGDDYVKPFERAFADLAKQYRLAFVPFLMDGLWTRSGSVPGMVQDDGIHPTAQGTPLMARTVFRQLEPVLKKL
jgi:acyl-CoA thioesterase-1